MNRIPFPICLVSKEEKKLDELRDILSLKYSNIHSFQKGTSALIFIEKERPAILLSDETLSDMSGVEVLRRAHALSPDTRRILYFSLDPKTAMEAINVGHAHQILQKPIEKEILFSAFKTAIERYEIDREMAAMTELIREHHAELAKAHKHLRKQVELGGKIHETLLMGKVPEKLPALSIHALTEPTDEIDGDFYEFFRPSLETMDLVIGDVMGKGLPAALVGTAVKTQFLRFAEPPIRPFILNRESLWKEDILSVREIVSKVHQTIASNLMRLEYFVTLFYIRFDLGVQKIAWIDLGSTKPLHYSLRTKEITELKGEGLPLGVMDTFDASCQTKSYEVGDIFVFYSDGLSEASSEEGMQYDKSQIRAIIKENSDKSAEEIAKLLYQDARVFHGNKRFEDDATLIVIKMAAPFLRPRAHELRQKFSPEISQLEAVRALIHRFCDRLPGDNKLLADHLALAMNELFCNIVKHGYKNKLIGPVWIHCLEGEEGVEIEVSDSGASFNPWKIVEPSLFGDQEGGYGWYIIRKLSDEVTYLPKQKEGGWNHTRLFKHFYVGKNRMDVHHREEENVLIITPMGPSLDAREAPDFKEKVFQILSTSTSKHLVLDLHHLTFVDSSGLGAFLSILRRLNVDEGDLKLVGMTKSVRSMFELVSMHKIFEIFDTPEEAFLATKSSLKKN